MQTREVDDLDDLIHLAKLDVASKPCLHPAYRKIT